MQDDDAQQTDGAERTGARVGADGAGGGPAGPGQTPGWLATGRDRRFRSWSIGLGLAGPFLGFVALVIVLGFDLQRSTGGDASPGDAVAVAVLAVVLGVVVPVGGAVALVVLSRRAQLSVPGGVVIGGAAGLLAALLLVPWTVSATTHAAEYRAALAQTTQAERQDPDDMRQALDQLYQQVVRALPDARPGQYDDVSTGRLEADDWVHGHCPLSVGWDGQDWTSVTLDSYAVEDVRAALDAVAEDAAAHGQSTELRTDDQDGAVRDLAIRVRSGTVYVSPVVNQDVTHDSGEVELSAATHCVQ